MPIIFFTGFPGFLGSELLPRILDRSPGHRAVCLVQPKFAAAAQARLTQIEDTSPQVCGRVELAAGDITQPDLGLEGAAEIKGEVDEIFHLAAVYDLSVPRDLAMRVNVRGTRNVLDFAKDAPRLRRLQYVSTCYVSGRHPGVFGEDDLEQGQRFNNYYEETKYLAEVDVQRQMRGGLPTTVYRPAIVVGDSRTGATQKYDGPYCVIRWLLRQPYLAVLPTVGDPTATRVNLVPRDYVIDAISYLSGRDTSTGKVFHLADPDPMTVRELVGVLAEATRRRVVQIPLPLALARLAIDYVPGVYRLMQIPSAAIDYFVHPTHYACASTLAALEPSGLKPPPFSSYATRLVDFVRSHPEIGSGGMV